MEAWYINNYQLLSDHKLKAATKLLPDEKLKATK
jgi:hypothetical protein